MYHVYDKLIQVAAQELVVFDIYWSLACKYTYSLLYITFNLEKSVERGIIMQDIGFTVLSKNLRFTHRLIGHFLEVLWDQ